MWNTAARKSYLYAFSCVELMIPSFWKHQGIADNDKGVHQYERLRCGSSEQSSGIISWSSGGIKIL
jgi:hypothetical protein